jgi:hypothetical protein
MAKVSGAARESGENREPSKRELQRQMERTRESLAETVDEIKETIGQEVSAVKKTVTGVLDYREEFQKEPLVWSLGALSAGFALGYTLGYAHKNTKGGKQTPVIAFADSMVEEMSTLGKGLVMPALDAKIKELFGFEFSELLAQVGGGANKRTTKRITKRVRSKRTKKQAAKKK